jgi:hypothetical protein
MRTRTRIALVNQSVEPKRPAGAVEGSNEIPSLNLSAVPEQDPNAPADPNAAQPKADPNAPPPPPNPPDADKPDLSQSDTSQIEGTGPIVGVVSLSRQHSIREFSHKTHYDEWKFYYDAGSNRGPVAGPTRDTVIVASPPAAPAPTDATKGN